MSTQVQIQGNVEATQEARTLVSRVLDINTTDNRLAVHNGSTPGGIPHVTYRDYQNNEFTYAIATGTNAIAISLSKAPTGYIQGQEFIVKPVANNTGAVTLNVNSLGAKNVYKDDGDGTLVALEVDDLKSGIPVKLIYDGTQFVLFQGGGGTGKGALILLSEVSLNNDSQVVFNSSILDGTYSKYVVDYMDIEVPDGTFLYFQTSDDNGSTWETNLYQAHYVVFNNIGPAVTAYNSGTVTSGYLSASAIGTSGAGEPGISGTLEMIKPHDTDGLYRLWPARSYYTVTDGNLTSVQGSIYMGNSVTANGCNAIRFYASSGNMASGIIKIYGVL